MTDLNKRRQTVDKTAINERRNKEMEQDKITISIEEYKELLIIKGKYEELSKFHKPLILSGDHIPIID